MTSFLFKRHSNLKDLCSLKARTLIQIADSDGSVLRFIFGVFFPSNDLLVIITPFSPTQDMNGSNTTIDH